MAGESKSQLRRIAKENGEELPVKFYSYEDLLRFRTHIAMVIEQTFTCGSGCDCDPDADDNCAFVWRIIDEIRGVLPSEVVRVLP